MTILMITGTGTEIGKTITTAAVASVAVGAGKRVAVVKPAQTGLLPGQPGDVHEVQRLVPAVHTTELYRYPEPLAPNTAARRSGQPAPDLDAVASTIVRLNAEYDLVLVEGAGGLLVGLDAVGRTIADLALLLDGAPVVVVAAAGLGTLNSVALTAEALAQRDLPCTGIIIGAWPTSPDLAERCNLIDLPVVGSAPLVGVLPERIGALDPREFAVVAQRGIHPTLGGTWRAPPASAGAESTGRRSA